MEPVTEDGMAENEIRDDRQDAPFGRRARLMRRTRLTAERALSLVRSVRNGDEPFGKLRLVRRVLRPRKDG